MDNDNLVKIFSSFNPSCMLITINNYKNNYGEIANFNLAFHISYKNALEKSKKIASEFKAMNSLEEDAKKEVLDSIENSIQKYSEEEFIEPNYSHFKDFNGNYIKGIKQHNESNSLYLYGMEVHKFVVEAVERRPVKSSIMTMMKNKIRNKFPISKFRQFKIEPNRFSSISIEKMKFQFDGDDLIVRI